MDLNNAPGSPGAYAAFDSVPPPAPELHSEGVIAMDITEQFVDAALSRSSFRSHVLSRADFSRARCWTAYQRALLYTIRSCRGPRGELSGIIVILLPLTVLDHGSQDGQWFPGAGRDHGGRI